MRHGILLSRFTVLISLSARHKLEMTFPARLDVLHPDLSNNFNSSDSTFDVDSASERESDRISVDQTDNSSNTPPQSPRDNFFEFSMDPEKTLKCGKEVHDASEFKTLAAYAASRIENGLENASYLLTNLSPVVSQYHQWRDELPMVEPFYAVKCNPDPVILRLLASLGCGFDCATMGEMDLVLHGMSDDLNFAPRGLASTSIVYANPAKMENMIQFALDHNVRMTVFDDEDELYKISSIPGSDKFELLLRLATDDKASICQFSKKFGCPVKDAPRLLKIAKTLGLNIAGVSFHVGSGCGDPASYTTALDHSRLVFEAAETLGMPPLRVVDIGGGFPGDAGGYGGPGMPTFQILAATIRSGIADLEARLPSHRIRFIAEPGRYFVSACTSVVTKVYSRKGGRGNSQALYVDDGVYGSFVSVCNMRKLRCE